MPYKATEVFTPNDFPVHSYVKRASEDLENLLGNALDTPKAVISISGPSKAGKTVLIEKVVGADRLITISGAQVSRPSDLWDRVLDWMGIPESETGTSTSTIGGQVTATTEGKVGVPLIAEGKVGGTLQGTYSQAKASAVATKRTGLAQVEREIAGSDFVVFVDDFHYIPGDVQTEVAKQVKAAAGLGIRICLAAVPHRSDDAVRSNSELRGRTAGVDVGFWSLEELAEIATRGFSALGYDIAEAQAARFAREACGSPQLMQQICLQACFLLGLREGRADDAVLNLSGLEFSEEMTRDILERASLQTDYTSLVRDMHAGPKTRGTERKVFEFQDGSRGDVYRAILLALSVNPPVSEISYADFAKRIESVCVGESPGMGSVITSARQISTLARSSHPNERIVEWEDNAAGGLLSISDPYLLFYLRSSSKLSELGKAGN